MAKNDRRNALVDGFQFGAIFAVAIETIFRNKEEFLGVPNFVFGIPIMIVVLFLVYRKRGILEKLDIEEHDG